MHSVVEGYAGVEDVQLRIHGSFPIPWKEGTVRTTSAEGSSGEGLRRDAQNTSQVMARE